MSVRLLTEHHLEFLKLKRRLHRITGVYTCQNATSVDSGEPVQPPFKLRNSKCGNHMSRLICCVAAIVRGGGV